MQTICETETTETITPETPTRPDGWFVGEMSVEFPLHAKPAAVIYGVSLAAPATEFSDWKSLTTASDELLRERFASTRDATESLQALYRARDQVRAGEQLLADHTARAKRAALGIDAAIRRGKDSREAEDELSAAQQDAQRMELRLVVFRQLEVEALARAKVDVEDNAEQLRDELIAQWTAEADRADVALLNAIEPHMARSVNARRVLVSLKAPTRYGHGGASPYHKFARLPEEAE
jgi:hypothetical protein